MTPLCWVPTLRLPAPATAPLSHTIEHFQRRHGDYGYVVAEDPAMLIPAGTVAAAPLAKGTPVILYDFRHNVPDALPDAPRPREIWVSLPRGVRGPWPVIAQFFTQRGPEDRLVWFATDSETLDDRLLTLWSRLGQEWHETYPPLWLDFLSFGEAWCAYAAALYPWVQIANVPEDLLARLEQVAKDAGRPLIKRSRLRAAPDVPLSLPRWATPTA